MKRQREADERERVRMREQRRTERRERRRQDREPEVAGTAELPIIGSEGPRSIAELRSAQLGAATADIAGGDDSGEPRA